jgi:hypothetical protein
MELYGSWNPETLDSAGGWLATTEDVLLFAMVFDNPRRCKILKEASIAIMFARPTGAPGKDKDGKPSNHYYGCDWNVGFFDGGG